MNRPPRRPILDNLPFNPSNDTLLFQNIDFYPLLRDRETGIATAPDAIEYPGRPLEMAFTHLFSDHAKEIMENLQTLSFDRSADFWLLWTRRRRRDADRGYCRAGDELKRFLPKIQKLIVLCRHHCETAWGKSPSVEAQMIEKQQLQAEEDGFSLEFQYVAQLPVRDGQA